MTRRVPPSPAQVGPAKMFPRLSEDICPDQYNWWLARYYPYLGASACVNISLCYRVMTSCIRYCSQDPAIAPSAKIPGYL